VVKIVEPLVIERRISCPHCAESMDVVVDLSGGSQSYIEDCQVCCQPVQFRVEVDDGRLLILQVERA
jgi:transcription elongation factor Elf1